MVGSKQFIKGAFIMSIGLIITKVLGLIFVFPFAAMVGQEGQALYSYAYVPYTFFIDIATLGIPMGVAKFVAKYNSINEYNTSYKIFKISLVWLTIVGIILCVLLVMISPFYAEQVLGGREKLINSVNDVEFVIQVVSLALIIIPVVSLFRGFFQGFQNMVPSTVSQIIEQGTRVLFILISVFIVIYILKGSVFTAVSWAVFAVFISGIAALITLLVFFRKFKPLLQKYIDASSFKNRNTIKLIGEMLKYALPFAIFGLNFAIYQLIDSLMFNKALLMNGYNNPEMLYGIYSFEVQKLIMIPVTIAIAFSASLMPAITSNYTNGNMRVVRNNIRLATQIIFFITMPVVVGFMMYSDQVYAFLYGHNEFGGRILKAYAPVAILFCFNNITMSTLQGLNQQKFIFKSLSVGIFIKLVLNYPLLIFFGVDGAILATAIGYTIAILLNYIKISFSAKMKFRYIVNSIFVIILISVIMGVVLLLIDHLYLYKLDNVLSRFSCFVYVLLNAIIGAGVYFVLSFYFGVIEVILGARITWNKLLNILKSDRGRYY